MDEEDKHCLLWRVTKSPLACWHNTSLLAGRFCKSPLCPSASFTPARRTIMHCHAATLHKAYPLKLVDENLESGSMAGKAGHAWQSCFAAHCMQSQRWQQRVAREEKRVLDQHNHDSILAPSVSFSHWMTFVISSKPCSITRRLHCTCTQRCLRHCMLNGVESTRCHQLFCHHGCQLYKMPPWICCHAQATCPSALSLESGTARSRGHRDIERTSRETPATEPPF